MATEYVSKELFEERTKNHTEMLIRIEGKLDTLSQNDKEIFQTIDGVPDRIRNNESRLNRLDVKFWGMILAIFGILAKMAIG